MKALAAVAVSVLVLMGGCATSTLPVAPSQVPLPKLASGPVEMRVAHVVNPRLPKMDAQQIQALLEAARSAAKAHFQVDLVFTEVREIPIAQAFAAIPERRRQGALGAIYDFKSGRGDPERLAR